MAAPVFTNDERTRSLLRSIRMHGQGSDRYEHVRIGINSRLDTIQAAILIEKLKIFPDEIEKREAVAQRYNEAFAKSNRIRVPRVIDGRDRPGRNTRSRSKTAKRCQAALKADGVPTAVYYPIPLSHQKGYAALSVGSDPSQ